MIQFEDYLTIGKAAEKLKERNVNVQMATLRNWFNELENLKVHSLPRTANNKRERVLSPLELDIAEFIYNYRQKFGQKISMSSIVPSLREKFNNLYYDDTEDGSPGDVDLIELQNTVVMQIEEQVSILKRELHQEMIEELERRENAKQLALPDPSEIAREEERRAKEQEKAIHAAQLNLWTTENRVKLVLKSEAENLWNSNPVKTGIFIKREDLAKKMEFIQKYIDDNKEVRMLEIMNSTNENTN